MEPDSLGGFPDGPRCNGARNLSASNGLNDVACTERKPSHRFTECRPGPMDTSPSTPSASKDITASDPAASPPDSPESHALDPAIQVIWTIKLAGYTTLIAAGVFFYDLTHWLGGTRGLLSAGVLTAAVVSLGAAYSLLWPRLRYRYWSYELRPEELFLKHGVFNRVRTIVPLRRIQHLDVSQDVLEREFSLGRLIVHTAGSRSSDVVIPGLKLERAERMRDEVKRYILDDPLMEDPV